MKYPNLKFCLHFQCKTWVKIDILGLKIIINLCLLSTHIGEKNPTCYVTGYDMEKQRNDEGEAEIASHFEKKCGFDNMEFDSKSSKTLQKDGTLKVVSNCTCVTDGTFTEFFQPEDGCGITYAKELHKVVNKYHAEETFTYIGADSTVSNTGPKGGKCFLLEKIFTL